MSHHLSRVIHHMSHITHHTSHITRHRYGPKHHEALLDEFHTAAERCDSLQVVAALNIKIMSINHNNHNNNPNNNNYKRLTPIPLAPQSFFMMHSLGGGTGSGLGSYVLEMLADHFPAVIVRAPFRTCKFTTECPLYYSQPKFPYIRSYIAGVSLHYVSVSPGGRRCGHEPL